MSPLDTEYAKVFPRKCEWCERDGDSTDIEYHEAVHGPYKLNRPWYACMDREPCEERSNKLEDERNAWRHEDD